jgi:hypothetical protein
LLILKRRIFDSNVCRGILSFAATPEGPEMRPCARKFDGLANSLGDRAQIPLICLQFLLGALPVIDIGVDSIATDDVWLVQLFGRH